MGPVEVPHRKVSFTFQVNMMKMLLMMLVRMASFSSSLLLVAEVRVKDVVEIVEKS